MHRSLLEGMQMADFESIVEALTSGEKEKVIQQVRAELDDGTQAGEILTQGLIKGMDIVGEKMEKGDMFIPEVLRCAKIMQASLEILQPLLYDEEIKSAGKIVIGTVKGDLHDIGKNLVKMMLESAGFEVIDLGVDVTPEAFIKAIRETKANILALSALLTTTMPMMKQTIDSITEHGLRDNVKVLVGGAPVTQTFAEEIGADGYAADAGSVNRLARRLIR